MTAGRKTARKAEMEARIRETWERWRLANMRAERVAKIELIALAEELLKAQSQLSVEELIDEHRARSGLPLKQAIAEVEEYHRDVTQRLRDRGLLVYPVTEIGFTMPVLNATDVRAHVPGMGRGQSTFGWRIATVPGDPVFIAYWNMRLAQSSGGVRKIADTVNTAVAAGIVATPLPNIRLPTSITSGKK